MADEEQLEIIVEDGIVRFNVWRASNANITPDLSHADLKGNYLNEAKFREANLAGADLSTADFRNADLAGANLTTAKLEKANLGGANLTGASLEGCHLSGANFEHSNLTDANLRGANVVDAKFARSTFNEGTLGLGRLSVNQREGMQLATAEPRSDDELPEAGEEVAGGSETLTVGYAKSLIEPAHWALQTFDVPNDLKAEHRDLFVQLIATVADLHQRLAAVEDENRRLAESEDLPSSIDQALPLWKRAFEEFVLKSAGGLGDLAARGTSFAAGFVAGMLYNTLSPGAAGIEI